MIYNLIAMAPDGSVPKIKEVYTFEGGDSKGFQERSSSMTLDLMSGQESNPNIINSLFPLRSGFSMPWPFGPH